MHCRVFQLTYSIASPVPVPDHRMSLQGFPGDSVVKNPPVSTGDMGLILVLEDPTCHGTDNWVHEPQLLSQHCRAHEQQLLNPSSTTRENHNNEKPKHRNWRRHSNEDSAQP